VVAVSLKKRVSQPLTFTGPVLADIYLCKINT